MSRSSARRGQAEPLAALAASVTVALAFAVYAGVVPPAFPTGEERDVAEATATGAVESLRVGGVVRPVRLDSVTAPSGHQTRVTIRAANRTWRRGPDAPPDAARSSRLCPVRVNGSVRPGRVVVEVWS